VRVREAGDNVTQLDGPLDLMLLQLACRQLQQERVRERVRERKGENSEKESGVVSDNVTQLNGPLDLMLLQLACKESQGV
jgi:hypothetical protein